MSRPHIPDIFDGLRERFCAFAIFIETGLKLFKKEVQQSWRPQLPRPPTIFAS